MKLSHLNGLRALEATLRNGTFTAAADELGVTVAAVGQQIRGLEDYVGVRLFERLPTGAQPTDEALSIASLLSGGFTQLDGALTELRTGGREQTLSLTMSQNILDDLIASRMPDFHRRYPDVKVSYRTGEEFVDLFKGDVDMAIRFSPEPGPDYEFDDLYKSCFMPVCTPEFAEQYGLTPETRDLTGVPLYKFHDVTADPAWVDWPELLARHGIDKRDDGPEQQIAGYRIVLSGEGLVLCGLTESIDDLADGRTVAPLGPKFVTEFTFGYRLVWPSARTMTRPMRNFRTWLLKVRDDFVAKSSTVLGVELH